MRRVEGERRKGNRGNREDGREEEEGNKRRLVE